MNGVEMLFKQIGLLIAEYDKLIRLCQFARDVVLARNMQLRCNGLKQRLQSMGKKWEASETGKTQPAQPGPEFQANLDSVRNALISLIEEDTTTFSELCKCIERQNTTEQRRKTFEGVSRPLEQQIEAEFDLSAVLTETAARYGYDTLANEIRRTFSELKSGYRSNRAWLPELVQNHTGESLDDVEEETE